MRMNAAANKQIVQRIFEGLAEGNSRPLIEAMAEDFCWDMCGTTSWSRRYDGKQTVIDELFGPLRQVIAGQIKTVPRRFIAEGDTVVVLARGNNVTVAGQPYCNDYCMVCRLRDGKLVELVEYLDTELVTKALGDPPQTTGAAALAAT
jgi:ketosteroid isomerase-like protein